MSSGTLQLASTADIRRILGDLDDVKVTQIHALKPTVPDLEDVACCMTGDHDVLAKSGHHVPAIAAQIIEMLVGEVSEPLR